MTSYRDRMNAGTYAPADKPKQPKPTAKPKSKRSSSRSTPDKETPKNA